MCSICVNGVSQRLKIGFIKWRKDLTGIYYYFVTLISGLKII